MANTSIADVYLNDIKTSINESKQLIEKNDAAIERIYTSYKEVLELEAFIKQKNINMSILKASANLLSNVMDKRMGEALGFITEVINDALRKIYPQTPKKIKLDIGTFKDSYPQLNVKLITPDGVRNLKTQEGTGLKQLISMFYIMCLIYIGGGRRFVYLDEVMDGFHEDAIEIVDTILDIFVKDLGFQIVINEHGYPIGENTVAYFLGWTKEGTQVVNTRRGWEDKEVLEKSEEVTIDVVESDFD